MVIQLADVTNHHKCEHNYTLEETSSFDDHKYYMFVNYI